MKICSYVTILLSVIIGSATSSGANCFRKNNIKASPEQVQESKQDNVFSGNIKSVELYREGWDLSWPVIELGGKVGLVLEFDDLSDETGLYRYTVVHCDAEWNPSNILQSEYLSGFTEGSLRTFEYSRNTLQPYIHYRLKLPNEEINPVLPGNYLLKIYRGYDQDDLILTRRFFIFQPNVEIIGNAKRTDNVALFYTHQEVDFTVLHPNLTIDDPIRNIRVVVCQNWDWSNAKYDLVPTYINPGELIYDYEEENVFPGGNEYRYFDIKNLKYQSDRIASIKYAKPLNQVFLSPERNRVDEAYEYYEDINGRFYIKMDEGLDSDIDADYIDVHFSFPFDGQMTGGEFYIWGQLSSWTFLPESKMEYQQSTQSYSAHMPLKLGYYNYQIVFKPEESGKLLTTFSDENHFETENEYLIFVYFSDYRERFERLVGYTVLNSTGKLIP